MKLSSDVTDVSYFNVSYNATTKEATILGLKKAVKGILTIPTTLINPADGDVYKVTSIADDAFVSYAAADDPANLSVGITGIVIEDGIKTIGENAFALLSNLKTVDLSANTTLTSIGDSAFVYDPIQTLDFGQNASLVSIGTNAFTSAQISNLVLPTSIQTIGEGAFRYNSNLTTVNWGALTNLTTIGDNSFANDTNLQSATFMGSLKTIGDGAFNTDSALATVNFDNATSLTSIGNEAFEYDGKLVAITLPASLQTIGDYAFAADTQKDSAGNTIGGLTSIDFAPNSQLISIGEGAFVYDTWLTSVTLPDSLQTIGSSAFLDNTALTTIKLPASLQKLGDFAFTYDSNLTSVDMTAAEALTEIGNGVFEYTGLAGTLSLPTNLTTIGNQAFAGSHISNIVFNQKLSTIGTGAFIYNELAGKLVLPDNVTALGDQAFFSNQLTDVSVGPNTTIGQGAFNYNRITALSTGQETPDIASTQYAAIFTDTAHVSLDNLFATHVGSLVNADLKVSQIEVNSEAAGDQVTFDSSNDTFKVANGVNQFTFVWALEDATGNKIYNGTYQVVLNDPTIRVVNSAIWYGQSWTPADNLYSIESKAVTLADLTVTLDGKTIASDDVINDLTVGTHTVTYSYGNETETALVKVNQRQGSYWITGSQDVTYSGQTPSVTASNYQIHLTDGFPYDLKDGDLVLTPINGQTTDVGKYMVTVSPEALQRVLSQSPDAASYIWTEDLKQNTATLNIVPKTVTVTITGQKTAGQADPKPTVTVDDETVNPADYGFTIQRDPGEKVGSYAYSLTGTNPNIKALVSENSQLTISAAVPTLTGSNYSMKVGDPTPTAANFKPQGTDSNAEAIDASKVTLDLGDATLDKPGTYTVTLSYQGIDGLQTATVTLTVVAPSTGGAGDGGVDPTDPVGPTDPAKPDPKPGTTNDHEVISDGGVHAPGDTHKLPIVSGQAAVPHKTILKTTSMKSAATAKKATLPQTNDQQTPWWAAIGVLLGSLGVFGIRKQRRH